MKTIALETLSKTNTLSSQLFKATNTPFNTEWEGAMVMGYAGLYNEVLDTFAQYSDEDQTDVLDFFIETRCYRTL